MIGNSGALRYCYDTNADIGHSENEVEDEIKKKIRTVMLY